MKKYYIHKIIGLEIHYQLVSVTSCNEEGFHASVSGGLWLAQWVRTYNMTMEYS